MTMAVYGDASRLARGERSVLLRIGRAMLVAVLLPVLGLTAACDDGSANAADTPAPAAPKPLAEVGGACVLLDYSLIKNLLGVDLGRAAAGKQGAAQSCAVQPTTGAYPDLVLSVTKSGINEAAFTGTVQPNGAIALPQLGRAAYIVAILPVNGAGPGVEVGWLSANGQLLMLRYRLDPSKPTDALAETSNQVVLMAKEIDQAPPL